MFRLSLLALCLAVPVFAQPLHQRIDALVATGTPNFNGLAAPLADDAEFLRRLFLDLTGTIPSVQQVRGFLVDKSPGKRQQRVEQILASPEHARHLAQVFDVMLMERRPQKAVAPDAWREYLRTSVTANKPWDVMVRELLSADGSDAKTRPAARFLLDRDGEPHTLTRDVGRLFLGMDVQCAQCHDSPNVNDYKQDIYYGLFAFVNRTALLNDSKMKMFVLSEKADGEVSFQSVFDPNKVTKTSLPRVLDRKPLKDPLLVKGDEYAVKPEKGTRSVPKYSRRSQLAAELARADSVAFRQNLANRLWAHMMGVGLVHPVDMTHADNPPSHPALFQLLGEEAAKSKFDVRVLLREIALSKTYQRSSLPPANAKVSPRSFAVATLKPLPAESLAFALYQATGNTDVQRSKLGKNATEATLYQSVAREVAPLVKAFEGQAAKPEAFEPTLDQALFFANSPAMKGWMLPRGENLPGRLERLKDEQVADEAFLTVLTRLPSDEERKELAALLKAPGKMRAAVIQEILWAMVTSAEFRFNH